MTVSQPLAAERPRPEGGIAFELTSEFRPAGDQPQAISAAASRRGKFAAL